MVKYLLPYQISRLFALTMPARDRALLTVCFYRGLRASELFDIRYGDVDLVNNTITIRRLKRSNGGVYTLSPDERSALEAWMVHSDCAKHREHRLFPVRRRRIYDLFRKYAAAAGIPEDKQHPHVLKHSIATLLLSRGATPADVQDWLGHRSITSTMIYAQVTNERRRETERMLYAQALCVISES